MEIDDARREFAAAYTTAWCSQEPSRVASFFSEHGSLVINDGPPAVGRAEIAASAQSFMTAFPDLSVAMDALEVRDDRLVYHWTLTGTNSGPGGTGRRVSIRGREEWSFGDDALVSSSVGYFDRDDYLRQLG